MKQSGIARKLDKLGRIVVPIEISLFGHYILLHKYEDSSAASIELKQGGPILSELYEALNNLSDKDALMVLELLRRFTMPKNNN